MVTHPSKPLVIPSLIAFWGLLIFLMLVPGSFTRVIPSLRETAPTLTAVIGVFIILSTVGAIWMAISAARLHKIPVKTILSILIGYPLFIVVKALITGYFSSWVFRVLVFIVLINGLGTWYLLRASVRAFWSPGAPTTHVIDADSE